VDADAAGVGGDVAEAVGADHVGVGAAEAAVRFVPGAALGVDELDEGNLGQASQGSQVRDLERLDEDGSVSPVEAVAAEGVHEGLLEGRPSPSK